MGRKTSLSRLPREVIIYIEGLIAEGRFTLDEIKSDIEQRYPDHKAAGELPSRSALQRYGPKLERRLIAVKAFAQAAASIHANAGDKSDTQSSGLTSVVQEGLFDSLICLQEASDPGIDQGERIALLADAARAIASLTRSSVQLKEYQGKVEAEMRAKVLAEQKEKLKAMSVTGGVTQATMQMIHKALGIN